MGVGFALRFNFLLQLLILLHRLPNNSVMAAANSDEILHDFFPMLRVYKDGRIERLTAAGPNFVPPSTDPITAVQSKDVEIAPEINLSARIYLPENADRSKKLPLLVYFHGGGFITESAFSPVYHNHLNHLVARANIVAVSVNYRLAPGFPLPTAFEDSWRALKWTSESSDEWISEFSDPTRLYLGGDSAGGNIAHNLAMRVAAEKPEGINLRGIFLNCPYFWGKDSIGCETDEQFKNWKGFSDKLVQFVYPTASNADEAWINPSKDPKISNLACGKVLAYVSEKDFLKDRGWFYKEILSKSGWEGEIECVEVAGEEHVFSVYAPDSENAIAMLNKIATFISE